MPFIHKAKYRIVLHYTSKHGIVSSIVFCNHTQAGGAEVAGVGLFIVGKILQYKND